jgi:hypothetical protein
MTIGLVVQDSRHIESNYSLSEEENRDNANQVFSNIERIKSESFQNEFLC